jgi:hypothetical protein
VIFGSQAIISRYIHTNNLYPIEYSKIALQISNNMYQSQYMIYKKEKLQSLYMEQKKSSVDKPGVI